MTLTLTPELEAAIQRKLDTGRFRDPVEVLSTAMQLLSDEDTILAPYIDSVTGMLDESFAAAERGEMYTGEEARAYLAKMRKSL